MIIHPTRLLFTLVLTSSTLIGCASSDTSRTRAAVRQPNGQTWEENTPSDRATTNNTTTDRAATNNSSTRVGNSNASASGPAVYAVPRTDTDAVTTPAPANQRGDVESLISAWPNRPKLGARQMIAKYGPPQEATAQRLIWHKAGPFKRITVFNFETPHDFPLPHMDYMEHTIAYDVPQDKIGDLIAFDGSSTINVTVGELSARCDLEGHNVLTLNLDHDIITGKKSVQEARQAFAKNIEQDVLGKHPEYVTALQFKPKDATNTGFSDKPVIPGSPIRAEEAQTASVSADAEVLAMVIASDLNTILAAMQAQQAKISQPIMAYAKMLHEDHGMNMVKTLKLGKEIGVEPIETADVDKMKVKAAGELAALIPLDVPQFEKAFIAAMIKSHTETLSMIDNKLLKSAQNDALKAHLTATREHVAKHLMKTQELQGSTSR